MADAAIHHVRRRDDVGAGRRVRQRRAREELDGGVVDDFAVDEQAAVAVRGVLAQAHVGDDEQVRHFLLERAHRGLHRRVAIPGRRAGRVLAVRQPEQQHAGYPVGLRRRGFLHDFVDRELKHARHRRHFAPLSRPGAHEQRVEEHVRAEPRLAHQRAESGRPAEPPQAARAGRAGRGPKRRRGRAGSRGSSGHVGGLALLCRGTGRRRKMLDQRVDEIRESCSAWA